VLGLLIALVVVAMTSALTGRPVVADATMEPSFAAGTRLWVKGLEEDPERGDVVLVAPDSRWDGVAQDSAGSFTELMRWLRLGAAPPGSQVITRIIGGPGDEVRCCSPSGQLLVNGKPVPTPGGNEAFRVVLSNGLYFVATDSMSPGSSSCYLSSLRRAALISTDQIKGRVVRAGWPWARRPLDPARAPYTGVPTGGPVPAAPIIESAKDPYC